MMAHFGSYDTTDEHSGDGPLQKEETRILGPMETNAAQNITGSIYVDQSGVLKIQQSFDQQNWDLSQNIVVQAKEGKGFDLPLIAPYVRIVYENGLTNQGIMRLFARTIIQGV